MADGGFFEDDEAVLGAAEVLQGVHHAGDADDLGPEVLAQGICDGDAGGFGRDDEDVTHGKRSGWRRVLGRHQVSRVFRGCG